MKKREEEKDIISFVVRMPRDKINGLLWVIPNERTVGVQFVNKLKKAMEKVKIERGMIVASGRYTSAAKAKAKKNSIELLARIFPAFEIFGHELVPKHELLTLEERKKILAEYRVQPYQLPRIRAADPAAKAIGARPGDIVRVIRKSPTAGKYVSYRYVVEG